MTQPQQQILLADLAFSRRIMSVFANNNLVYVDDLTEKTRHELCQLRSRANGGNKIGYKSYIEIFAKLDKIGRSLKSNAK